MGRATNWSNVSYIGDEFDPLLWPPTKDNAEEPENEVDYFPPPPPKPCSRGTTVDYIGAVLNCYMEGFDWITPPYPNLPMKDLCRLGYKCSSWFELPLKWWAVSGQEDLEPEYWMWHDVFWQIDSEGNFESIVIRYNPDNSIHEIQYFDGDVGIIYEPASDSYRLIDPNYVWMSKDEDGYYFSLNTSWEYGWWWAGFNIEKTASTARFFFFSDVRVKGFAGDFGDSGVLAEGDSFRETLGKLKPYKDWPWRVWRRTRIFDECYNIYEKFHQIVYDDSNRFSPYKINLSLLVAGIKQQIANELKAKIILLCWNFPKERNAKLKVHVENQTAVKIQQDVCILEEPQATIKQYIDTEVKTVISESINQPVVKIKQELIYEYEAGAKFLIFVYIQFQRFRANLKISLQGENKAVLRQEITRVPEAKIVQYVDTPISVKISEDLTRIPEVKLKQHIDTEAKVKIKYLLTHIPKTTLKIKVRTYNRAPTDYYSYYGIRIYGFLRS